MQLNLQGRTVLITGASRGIFDIKLQTRFVVENLKKTFEAAGSSLDNVIKAQVFLNGFDEVWKEYFNVPPPRTTIGTTGLLVRDTLVEIDLIGVTNR